MPRAMAKPNETWHRRLRWHASRYYSQKMDREKVRERYRTRLERWLMEEDTQKIASKAAHVASWVTWPSSGRCSKWELKLLKGFLASLEPGSAVPKRLRLVLHAADAVLEPRGSLLSESVQGHVYRLLAPAKLQNKIQVSCI